MALRLRKRAPSVTGLDLDPATLSAVELGPQRQILRSARHGLAPGVLRDGEVIDPGALTAALRELFDATELPRRVRLGISGQRVVVRTLLLPPIDDPRAIEAAIEREAAPSLPIAVEDAVLDHVVLGKVSTPAGPKLQVILVAARRAMVDQYVAALREAELETVGIDLSAFALVRSLAAPDDGADGTVYINYAGLTNVAVATGADCVMARTTAGGYDTLVHRLCEQRGLTAEHASQWIAHVGLAADATGIEGDATIVAATRAALEDTVRDLADGVRTSLNFYRSQQHTTAVGRCVLAGPAGAIAGFGDELARQLSMPVEVRDVRAGDPAAEAPGFAVAAGLAVAA